MLEKIWKIYDLCSGRNDALMGSVRYSRHIALPEVGEEGQARLALARALVIGLGGLGCPATQYLAASGIGSLVLNDFDRVDESNLARQILYGPADVGRLKVEAARDRLLALNPGVAVECLATRLDPEALEAHVEHASVVLDGTDSFAARLGVNAACVKAGVPLVSGAAVRLEGQLAVFTNKGAGPCYRCVYEDGSEWLGNCEGSGVLSPVTGVIGALMAVETLKLLVGIESDMKNQLLLWDATTGRWQEVGLKPKLDCPICQAR